MTTELTDTVFNCNPNLSHCDSLNSIDLSPDALAAFGTELPADINYRVELARHIARTFDDADQIILFDDVAIQILGADPRCFADLRGYDRSLLPALWLSTGFRCGGRILVYAPPNPIELGIYLKLRHLIEQHLKRNISIEIFYEDSTGHLHELIRLFEENPQEYMIVCEKFIERSPDEFYPEYHIRMLKRHFETIMKDVRRSFVFPYDMNKWHQDEIGSYSDRLYFPDVSNNDKAQHHFFLRSNGFTALPRLIAVSIDGSLIENYQELMKNMEQVDPVHVKNTFDNIEVFSRAIIQAIDHLHNKYQLTSFVKLDSLGAGGWSSMAPSEHPIIYDIDIANEQRVSYLHNHLDRIFEDEPLLSLMAVVEEFIEPQKRSDDIDADYTVCGFVLSGKFFPTSINLCGTKGGVYIEQWTSSSPADIGDSPEFWQEMFHTYSHMVALEATEFSYKNGIYAGDLFITKDNQHKQRDWNIRRGGRSSPESMTIFGMANYETKLTLHMNDFGVDGKMNKLELFRLYTNVCELLSQDYGMYTFSSAFGYCCKDSAKGDILTFNILVHPKVLTHGDQHGQKQTLPKREHRAKVLELIRDTIRKYPSSDKTITMNINNTVGPDELATGNPNRTRLQTLYQHYRKRKLTWIISFIIVIVVIIIISTIIGTRNKTKREKTETMEITTLTTTEITTKTTTTRSTEIQTTTTTPEISTTSTKIKTTTTTTNKQLPPSVIISSNTKWKQNAITIAGGNGRGNGLNQLNDPCGIYVDNDDHSIYIADTYNHRIIRWEFGANSGTIVAVGNGPEDIRNQLNQPTDVILDKEKKYLIICDYSNGRVLRWSLQNSQDQQILIPDISCWGLAMDNNGDLYISDWARHQVVRWQEGDTKGTVVAGGNGQGNHLNQLDFPMYIFVDEYHSVYVANAGNKRVMKWMKNAAEGSLIAPGQFFNENSSSMPEPRSVIVDHMGNIYVSHEGIYQIMRWSPGTIEGVPVVGENKSGIGPTELNSPYDLSFDQQGNLYVADAGNARIQKFAIDPE
ncbi:unnamed protein product [Adineta steineri]|uniref:SMP-30/Gluconolactonase/LRE-like region domain-containing protein n=1 Tax=Adineta steineri TaxID=433720 RepID=A0A818TRV3_9BILA|nr:unnamed protein product [Adineta steineri]